jgi:hypothetical protein
MKHKKFKGDNELFFFARRLKDIVSNNKWLLINLIMTKREVINSIYTILKLLMTRTIFSRAF